jgi:ADP-ribose pyrophosphatase YjhB (NUDIX family)
MKTHWRRPPELERERNRDRFDPIREGDGYRLSREVSLAIWERVCADADGLGRRDQGQAEQRFHQVAALVAARGGWLRADIGRLTRVESELGDIARHLRREDPFAPRTPGRETLVAREGAAQRSAPGVERAREPRARTQEPEPTQEAGAVRRGSGAAEPADPPQATEVAAVIAALFRTPSAPPASAPDGPERVAARRGGDPVLTSWPLPDGGRRSGEGLLPAATRERMEQAYGQRFDDVEIHMDSADVPVGQQAFTRGRHIYFERGAFEPDSEHGEHVIAHELAHIAQQSQPASEGRRPATRAALEADAHQAALAALAGRAATVNLFAPPSAALAFSNGEPERHPDPPQREGGPPPATAARTAGLAASGHPTPSNAALRSVPSPGSSGPGVSPAASPAARPATATPAASPIPVAAAPRGGASADNLLVPEAPSALQPGAAARLQTIHGENQGVAAATTALPTADQQTDIARRSVVEPKTEQDANAQHGVVTQIDNRPPPSPEIEQAVARIRQVIRDKRPPSEDKLVDARPKEMAQAAGQQMSGDVQQRADTVRGGYADMQQPPQGQPSTQPVPATVPPAQAKTNPVDAGAGAPDPLKQADVSLDGDVAAQQQNIQAAGMNTEAGQLVKDGPIGDAHGGVSDLETMAKTDPQKVLADQAAAIATAKGDMQALQAAAENALATARAGAVDKMAGHNTTVKGSEEQQRAEAGAKMQAVFATAQKSVDGLLQPLSGNAVKRWEAGVAQLSTGFEASLAEVKRKIDERHSGVGGWITEHTVDAAFGLPDWVTRDYDAAEAKFADGATSLITDISRDVNQVIDDCHKLIDQARKDIDAVVKSLPASLHSWAEGEAAKLHTQLDQLNAKVDQTQHGLNQDLISRANGAVQTVRERVADLREQAKGLLSKIADALVEFAKNPGKAIVDGLLRLLAIPPASFWALVDKLGDVVSGIAADPKKFANTLMAGVGQGFSQFFHNFPIHLGQSLFQWLFSKMADAGIQMPLDFTIPSIVTLVFQVMGITWPRIKTILAKHIGAENVEVLDQAYQIISTLIMRGPLGVYHLVQEHLDPNMIIESIKSAAISYLMEAIITRVAARIIMMLNPAGAILQAIEAIYRVIKWVIDNAARIFTLIEAVVNGAAQILAGNVSGVANLVERALGLLMIPVIDFLADYLGLGGIPAAIKKVIMGLQSKIEQILDKVIGFLVDKAKALWAAMKGKKDDKNDGEKKDDDPRTMEQKQADVNTAAQEATALLDQEGATEASVRAKLPPIKDKYKVVKLDLVVDAKDDGKERVHIHAEINPKSDGPEKEISERTYMGAKKTGPNTFEGDFGHKDWSWAGYPPVSLVMLHPANLSMGYHNDASVMKPTGSYKISSGTDGAPEPTKWRGELSDRKDEIKAEMLAKGMSQGDAENAAKKQVESEYAAQGYAYGWLDLNCYNNGTYRFQGHHILPANWSAPTDNSPSNLQYLAQAQHSKFTNWWEARKKAINDKLNAAE